MTDPLPAWLMILGGLGLLVVGGEWLVRGASALAACCRIPPLVIGLTVVAFGTSAPELGVSLQAAVAGVSDVAVGNVVGSNVFNVLFILGLSALITPLVVSSQLIRFDVPLMIAASLVCWGLAADGRVGRIDGILLFGILIGYLVWCVRGAKAEQKVVEEEFATGLGRAAAPSSDLPPLWRAGVWIVIGFVALGLGARWLVTGAVTVATGWGVSELVIGLTIVAVGTSLPEVVTSVVASLRGQREIAVGNVVGSNIFNLGCVLGLSGILAPGGIPVSSEAVMFDFPVMVAVAFACLPIFFTQHRIARWEGALFLAYFFAYNLYIVFAATGWTGTRTYAVLMLVFVIPLTAVTLATSTIRAWRDRRRSEGA